MNFKGPDEIPDPDLPLDQVLGGPPPVPIENELDPWGIRGPPPPPDVLNNGYQASLTQLIVFSFLSSTLVNCSPDRKSQLIV